MPPSLLGPLFCLPTYPGHFNYICCSLYSSETLLPSEGKGELVRNWSTCFLSCLLYILSVHQMIEHVLSSKRSFVNFFTSFNSSCTFMSTPASPHIFHLKPPDRVSDPWFHGVLWMDLLLFIRSLYFLYRLCSLNFALLNTRAPHMPLSVQSRSSLGRFFSVPCLPSFRPMLCPRGLIS